MTDEFEESMKKLISQKLKSPDLEEIAKRKEKFDQALKNVSNAYLAERENVDKSEKATQEKIQNLENSINNRNQDKNGKEKNIFQKLRDKIDNAIDQNSISKANKSHQKLVEKSNKNIEKLDNKFKKTYEKYHIQAQKDHGDIKNYLQNLTDNRAVSHVDEQTKDKLERHINKFIDDQMKNIASLLGGSEVSAKYFSDFKFTKEHSKADHAFGDGSEKKSKLPKVDLGRAITIGIAEEIAAKTVAEFGIGADKNNPTLPDKAVDFLKKAIEKMNKGGFEGLEDYKTTLKCVKEMKKICKKEHIKDELFQEFKDSRIALRDRTESLIVYDAIKSSLSIHDSILNLPPKLEFTKAQLEEQAKAVVDISKLPPPPSTPTMPNKNNGQER